MTEPRRIRLTLRPEPRQGGPDVWVRLRHVLKRLLRTHGFRCVKIETDLDQSGDADPATEDALSPGRVAQGKGTTNHTAGGAPCGGHRQLIQAAGDD